MRKTVIVFLILNCCLCLAKASDYPLSSSATLSLLTCGKGERVFESYGHSAIRLLDTVNHADVVFNYGAFNTSEHQFYIDFLMGKPMFYLVIVPTNEFLKEYKNEKRTVTESELNLTLAQRQRIFDFLLWNADSQNYAYEYDFVYNNCATKIRDVLKEQLSMDSNFEIPTSTEFKNMTLKQMLIQDMQLHPFVTFGFYTILGTKLDKYPTPEEWVFLPKNLETALDSTYMNELPLISKKKLILASAESNRMA